MKKIFFVICSIMSLSAFALEGASNQACTGLNQHNRSVEVYLYVGKSINKDVSEAKLIVYINQKHEKPEIKKEITGIITNNVDLTGTRMFKNMDDSLRFLTSGYIYDVNSYELRLNLRCDELIH